MVRMYALALIALVAFDANTCMMPAQARSAVDKNGVSLLIHCCRKRKDMKSNEARCYFRDVCIFRTISTDSSSHVARFAILDTSSHKFPIEGRLLPRFPSCSAELLRSGPVFDTAIRGAPIFRSLLFAKDGYTWIHSKDFRDSVNIY